MDRGNCSVAQGGQGGYTIKVSHIITQRGPRASNREGDCVRSCPTATAAATIGALRSSTVEPRFTRVFKDVDLFFVS